MCISHCVIYPSTARALSATGYLTPVGGDSIEIGKNAAYGHVIMTSQPGQHVLPPDDSENVYDVQH